MFILILTGLWDLALDLDIHTTDTDMDGAILIMDGVTRDITQAGAIRDIIQAMVMATIITLTTTEEEDLLLIMEEETILLTEATAPIEIIQPTEITILIETTLLTEAITQVDKIVSLTTEEVLM